MPLSPHHSGGYTSTQHAYLQNATPPLHQRSVGGSGGTLYVTGMADAAVKRGGCSSSFRTPEDHGDAHIKVLRHLSHDKMSPQPNYFTPKKSPSESRAGSAAFASKKDDRHSYIPSNSTSALTSRLFGLYEPSVTRSPHERPGSAASGRASPSASFRSVTPSASAHIPKNKPVEPHFIRDDRVGGSDPSAGTSSPVQRGQRPTSSFRNSADRDSYVKAQPSRQDRYSPLVSDFDKCQRGSGDRPGSASSPRGGTASFKSKTTIGDAHIRAMNKPVDVCLAYSPSRASVSPRRHSSAARSSAEYHGGRLYGDF
jgi:hypothetical protein